MQQVFNGFPKGALDLPSANFGAVHFINGSNYTTTSASLVAIDDTNLSVSVNADAGELIEVIFEAQFGETVVGNIIGIDWAVTRPTMAALASLAIYLNSTAWAYASIEPGTNNADNSNQTFIGHYVALESGTHIFRPRWRVGGGTASLVCQGAGARPFAVHHVAKIVH